MRVIELHPRNCTACGICELACSFHHSGRFGRAASSLLVRKDRARPEVALEVLARDRGARPACDDCAGEATPLCAHWCPVGAVVERRAHR